MSGIELSADEPRPKPGAPADLGVLVLAAGRGSRIAGVAGATPKPLLDVAGRSLLGWNLRWLAEWGVGSVWINLHHGAAAIRAALGEETEGVRLRYSQEEEILGTAGGWRRLAEHWRSTSLVVYGDNFMRFDLTLLLAAHRAAARPGTVALYDPDRHTCTGGSGGRVRVTGDAVSAFHEGGNDGHGAHVNAGVYLLEPEVATEVPPGFADFGHDVLPGLAAAGRLTAHVLEDGAFCLGLDTPERFAAAQQLVASGRVGA
ncbi:MAG: sugar phosphate nucleotidyltransferase [Gemmatimonadota bacterium]